MKQILKESELIGKTIKSKGEGYNSWCLIFEDDTFCIIKGTEWGVNYVHIMSEEIDLTPDISNAGTLVTMGLITEEEKNKQLAEVFKRQRLDAELNDLKEYIRLIKKFSTNKK